MEKREYNIDFLRVISSFMVVLLHTVAMGEIIPGNPGFLVNAVINGLTRFSVPVFLMISGYFMLDREKDCFYFIKRSIKLIFIMIGWSALYLLKYKLNGDIFIHSIKDVFIYLLTEPVHLWYFYALAVLILFTPALSIFAKKSDKKTYIYTIMLMLFFGSVISMLVKENSFPTLNIITEKLKVGTLLTFPAYYLFGYYVKRFGISKKISFSGFMAGLILTVSGVIILSFKKGILSENVLSFFSLNVAFMSMGIFAFFENIKLKEFSFVKFISPLTGGIYGLHLLILPSIYEKMVFLKNDFLRSILSALSVFIVCAGAVYLFKFIKNVLFNIFYKK